VFGSTLRCVLFLAIPAAVGLLVWRVPLVRLLLERGEFNMRSTALTAAALAFYSIGLIGHSAIEILARAYYALHDTRTPVIIGIAAMALNVALSLWLRVPLALAGLALANTIATTLEMILLLILLSRRLGGLEWPQLIVMVLKSGAAALLMAVPLWWAAGNLNNVPVLLLAPVGLVIGGLIYLGATALLRMPEVQAVRRLAPGRR
jgi:putative peptidoglycan lipid II flippase